MKGGTEDRKVSCRCQQIGIGQWVNGCLEKVSDGRRCVGCGIIMRGSDSFTFQARKQGQVTVTLSYHELSYRLEVFYSMTPNLGMLKDVVPALNDVCMGEDARDCTLL